MLLLRILNRHPHMNNSAITLNVGFENARFTSDTHYGREHDAIFYRNWFSSGMIAACQKQSLTLPTMLPIKRCLSFVARTDKFGHFTMSVSTVDIGCCNTGWN